jgi:hypothetical protein
MLFIWDTYFLAHSHEIYKPIFAPIQFHLALHNAHLVSHPLITLPIFWWIVNTPSVWIMLYLDGIGFHYNGLCLDYVDCIFTLVEYTVFGWTRFSL